MAKVMISMPDELLEQVDRRAKQAGTTRSGWLRVLAERAVEQDMQERAAAIRALLAQARRHGGNSAELIRADRNRDNP
jgi:metal-responsive CopG/Arc/MetJ family transcriptional regulator